MGGIGPGFSTMSAPNLTSMLSKLEQTSLLVPKELSGGVMESEMLSEGKDGKFVP